MKLSSTYQLICVVCSAMLLLPSCLHAQVPMCRTGIIAGDQYHSDTYLQWLAQQDRVIPVIRSRSVRYVDVVVHVVARESFQLITQAQALHQIDVLNRDFRAMGENTGKVPDLFQPLIANSDIQFCLATSDPDGNPTSGITHTLTPFADIAFRTGQFGERILHYDASGGKSGWDPERYVNIWVTEFGSFLGYATMPGWPVEEEVGIIIDIEHFGSIGDAGKPSRYGRGHTLTHEMGHFFGLLHIWGEGLAERCDDSDFIEDTPNVSGPNYHCDDHGTISSCGEITMTHNFMDLVDDRCLAFFTPDQVARMNMVIDTFYPALSTATSCPEKKEVTSSLLADIQISYDPGSQKVTLFHPEVLNGGVEVFVFSSDGRLIASDHWNGTHTILLELGSVARGMYIVGVRMEGDWHSARVAVY